MDVKGIALSSQYYTQVANLFAIETKGEALCGLNGCVILRPCTDYPNLMDYSVTLQFHYQPVYIRFQMMTLAVSTPNSCTIYFQEIRDSVEEFTVVLGTMVWQSFVIYSVDDYLKLVVNKNALNSTFLGTGGFDPLDFVYPAVTSKFLKL